MSTGADGAGTLEMTLIGALTKTGGGKSLAISARLIN